MFYLYYRGGHGVQFKEFTSTEAVCTFIQKRLSDPIDIVDYTLIEGRKMELTVGTRIDTIKIS